MNIMEMREALRTFDSNSFSTQLDELEQKRKDAFNLFLVVVFVLGSIVFFLMLSQGMTEIVKFAGVAAILISIFFYRRMAAIRQEAKKQLMPALCFRIGFDYTLRPTDLAIEPFKNLSIIPPYDEKTLEDQVTGKIEDVDFELLEAKLLAVHRDSKGRKSTRTVFNGFLVQFDFHKNFEGQTIIAKDRTVIGNFFSGWAKNGQRVKLEDHEFESQFEVHSTDQVEARYLLTPSFMERMLKFSRLPSVKQLQMAFKDGSVYMAIKRNGNAFEGGSFKLNDPALIAQNISDIAMIFDMVIELNLTQETKI